METVMTDQTLRLPVRRALISVSDKTGVVEFARELVQLGVEILSTGGTFKLLSENGIAAVEVADYTGFPEMMDGRVKTLHPKIHGGILGRRDLDGAVMSEHGIAPIDLVAVNLDRKSTRLNSSHVKTSYAVFCLKMLPRPPTSPLSPYTTLFRSERERHRRRGSRRLHRFSGNDGRPGEDPAPQDPRRHPRPS